MTEPFEKHQIARRSPDRIYFAEPGTSNLETEFILGARGTLIVHGDGPDFILRTYRDANGLEDLIRWAAGSPMDYLASKVVAGTARVYSSEQAQKDIRQMIQEWQADGEEEYANKLEAWSEDADFEFEAVMRLSLSETFVDSWEWSVGIVPSEDFRWLKQACIRCAALLGD